MENTNAKKRKRLSPILLIFIILAALTAALVCAALIIWMSGRASLNNKETKAPMLVEVPASAEPDENGGIAAPTPAPTPSVPIDYDITSGGRYYKYKDELINLLFIGVDSNKKPKEPLKYGNDNQADVIILASLDTVNDKMSLIAVNRDTMCDMAILDKDGNTAGVGRAQIALSYSYGDGLNVSCELCREAVSALFYGLQIDGYAAFYMGGVADLNDALRHNGYDKGGLSVQQHARVQKYEGRRGGNAHRQAGRGIYPQPPAYRNRQCGAHGAPEAISACNDTDRAAEGGGKSGVRAEHIFFAEQVYTERP